MVSQLESNSEILTWRDRARELVLLRSSSYYFAADSDWHDLEECWVGKNINTNDMVLLRCSQTPLSNEALNRFVAYGKRLANDRGYTDFELILAVEDNRAPKLTRWKDCPIRFETEDSLLDGLVNWTDYKNVIRRRVMMDPLADSHLTLGEVYVPPMLTAVKHDEAEPQDLQQYFNDWLNEPGHRQLALLGEYGQGKSSAAQWFVHDHLQNEERRRTPLLIELRGTSPRNLTPLQLLGAWASSYNINPQALLHLHRAGRLILIFEGFDEMALIGDFEMQLKHFKTLWSFCGSKSKILITGRPNFFLDEQETVASLGVGEATPDRPFCEALRIQPFTVEQIDKALRAQPVNTRRQICEFAEDNEQFLELVSRPSILHIVSVLWVQERLSEKLERLNSAFVMDLFVRSSYRRQGLKEVDSPQVMALNTNERAYFMKGIAAYMAANKLPNQIDAYVLNDVICRLIDVIPNSVSMTASAISAEVQIPLNQRIKECDYGIDHVQRDVRTCGILVDDPAAPGTFRFAHKSFMEFLFAGLVAERMLQHEAQGSAAITRTCHANPEHIVSMPVAIDFLREIVTTDGVNIGNSMEADLFIAKRLIRLVSKTSARGFLLRLDMAFMAVVTESLRMLSLTSKTGLLVFLGVSMMGWLATMLVAGFRGLGAQEWFNLNTLPALVGLLMSFFIGVAMSATRMSSKNWLSLCLALGIGDRTLHEAIGTHRIPVLRGLSLEKMHITNKIAEYRNSPDRVDS